MANNEFDGTPITGGGDGAAVATARDGTSSASEPEVTAHGETDGTLSASEPEVTAHGETDGTPITGGGDGAAIAGTPITGGGDGE
jgi:hypothetical protein